MTTPLEDRFWTKVAKSGPDDCWLWMRAKTRGGYGHFHFGSRNGTLRSNRAAWFLTHGVMPNLAVLHRCDNPACCNPAHLFLGTQTENMRDMKQKGRARTGPGLLGEANPAAKLTPKDILKIRAIYAAGGVSQETLGNKYGVAQTVISGIVRRTKWKHL